MNTYTAAKNIPQTKTRVRTEKTMFQGTSVFGSAGGSMAVLLLAESNRCRFSCFFLTPNVPNRHFYGSKSLLTL